MRERMAKLVAEHRLFIGPWYTQTDSFNVSGESIIRNLKYGISIAEKMGHCMNIGYLPDTFGHNAQMPTLLKGFGIDNIVFWRGINFDKHVKKANFFWQSLGGDRIIAYNLVHGYGAAKNIKATQKHLNEKIFPMVEKIRKLSGMNEILIPSGGDQVNIDPNLPAILRAVSEQCPTSARYDISSFEDYIEYLRKNSADFETYTGELKEPCYTRIHKTIGSVRYDIKKLNFEIEEFLLKRLEVIVAIAMTHGIVVHTELIDKVWKMIIESHAHDSMGGCNSDPTNRDIIIRLEQAKRIAHGCFNLVVKEIASQASKENEVLVFNSRPQPYTGLVDMVMFSKSPNVALTLDGQIVPMEVARCDELDGGKIIEVTKDGEREIEQPPYYRIEAKIFANALPALGYRVYGVVPEVTPASVVKVTSKSSIENERFNLSYCDGTLTLKDKLLQRQITDLLTFEEQADTGDTYDFSPLKGDCPLYQTSFTLLDQTEGEFSQTLRLSVAMMLPKNLTGREQGLLDVTQQFIVTLTLQKGESHLQIAIDTQNNVEDHRVRVLINSDLLSVTSLSTLPFAVIERPVGAPTDDEWHKKYREYPVDIETTDGGIGIVDASSTQQTMLVWTAGLKEYQILNTTGKSQIALTLFKSVGRLGKDDLLWRPGRASGINNTIIYTPESQLLQSMRFEFALTLGEKLEQQDLRALEMAYLARPFSYQHQTLNSFENRLERFQLRFDQHDMPSEFSLLRLPEPLILSSIAHSLTEKNALVLRVYNPSLDEVVLDLAQFSAFQCVEIVNYREVILPEKNACVRSCNSLDLLLIPAGNKKV